MKSNKALRILGLRVIPTDHGGFETFVEHLALYIAKNACIYVRRLYA
ncbi:DUF1972 domain-containing protein [Nitrosomonas aestuarii]|nr:DUF1972 domain-containing protein [Nitrosomonas aestuarii]